MQPPHFITDLGLILIVAGVTSLIFKSIKQPVVLGYILAGIVVGPHTTIFPTVIDGESIRTWSEIGVIILLFALGLEFSFKKLASAGATSFIAAITEISLMCATGFAVGQFLGWETIDSVFLGAIIAMSSTTIIIRTFEEAGMKAQKFISSVFGILIFEDLAAVILMVLLSTLAVSREFQGVTLALQIGKLVFFIIAWFIVGIFFIPSFLNRARKLLNDETLLVISLALCLLMVTFAVQAGFSAALGAFIMGAIFAGTTFAERIQQLVKPVKNLFAAVFFVSIGMLFDPKILLDFTIPVIVIATATILGKVVFATFGALLGGQSMKHSLQTGMSLAQIGELSFVIAALGISLKVTSPFLHPIVVAVSVITILIAPFLIRRSETAYNKFDSILPDSWSKHIQRYSLDSLRTYSSGDWRLLLRSHLTNALISSVIILAIILLSSNYLKPLLSVGADSDYTNFISLFITLVALIAPLWALSVKKINAEVYDRLWVNRGVTRATLVIIDLLRILLAALFVGVAFQSYFSANTALIVSILITSIAIFFFSRHIQSLYNRIEKRFLANLNDRIKNRPAIAPWDAHIADFEVYPEAPFIGKTLEELALREKYGVNIAMIRRGNITIVPPSRRECLYPGDKVSSIGSDEQLAAFKDFFEPTESNYPNVSGDPTIGLYPYTIAKDSFLIGQTLRNSQIREKSMALVAGIERGDQRILNPDSSMIFLAGDILWLVGNQDKLQNFFNEND